MTGFTLPEANAITKNGHTAQECPARLDVTRFGDDAPRWCHGDCDPEDALPLIGPLLCAPCYAEHRQGLRETPNPATAIVGGNSACPEHIVVQAAPILPGRTPGGLILGNGS